jgi:hypothetical protein
MVRTLGFAHKAPFGQSALRDHRIGTVRQAVNARDSGINANWPETKSAACLALASSSRVALDREAGDASLTERLEYIGWTIERALRKQSDALNNGLGC